MSETSNAQANIDQQSINNQGAQPDPGITDNEVFANQRILLMSVVYAVNKGLIPREKVRGVLGTVIEALIEVADTRVAGPASPELVIGGAYDLARKVSR